MDKRLKDNLRNEQHDYIAPFLWLHGEEQALVLRELEKIYDSGIRSVCLESRVHNDFCKKHWWDDVRAILDFCREKGMKAWILDDKRFPSGRANDAFMKEENANLRAWGITERHVDVAGPVTDGCVMADAHLTAPDDEIIGVLACRHIPDSEKYTQITDISDGLQDGMAWFDLPEGAWRIVFLIKTRSGIREARLNYCDMLEAESVKVFVDEVYEAHYDNLGEYFGNTLMGFFSDEPGFNNNSKNKFITDIGEFHAHYPWSDGLLPALTERLGERAREMLSGLWFDIEGVSDKIRYAYMDEITRRYSDNFCKTLGDWCHRHGLEYIGHVVEDNNAHARTGASAGHFFRAQEKQDMAGIDVVLHQIIPGLNECASAGQVAYKHMENNFYHYTLAKLASSFAHTDGIKKGRAMCEIFGAFGWAEGTRFMKYLTDHMLVRGINYFVPHAFSPKENDADCPPQFYDSGKNALFKYFKNIMDYMNRVCHLHTDGVHIPTAAILYNAEAYWVNRDRVSLDLCAKALYDNLLDYDVLSADMLERMDADGRIGGEAYPCLIIPYYEGMPDCITEKIKAVPIPRILVTAEGMKVKEELCGICSMVSVDELSEYVRKNIGADVTADYEGIYLRYYHCMRGGIHSYMFTNEDINNSICTQVRLSAFSGGDYILYDAMENKAYAGHSADGSIKLDLPPYNSVFVICGDVSTDGMKPIEADEYEETALSPVYKISYKAENENGFTDYGTTDKLFNFTGRNEMPHFSGNIRYEWQLDIEKTGKYTIDLGSVGEAAELFVNGASAGRKIIPPYTFDVSDKLAAGKNDITVIVSNHSGYEKRDRLSKFMLFEPSGMLGPVKLKIHSN